MPGDILLLTLPTLFLVDQLRASFASRTWPRLHAFAVAFVGVVVAACLFAMYTTSVYFHTPFEKFTGYGACRHMPRIDFI